MEKINKSVNSISFNVVMNDIELIQNEIDNFISEVQKTKEGKILSQEYLKNIFLFWKIKQLQEKLKSKQDSLPVKELTAEEKGNALMNKNFEAK